jgi:hypothetical protein
MDVLRIFVRIVLLALAAVVVGPTALVVWSRLPSVDGGSEATLLVTGGVFSGVARVVLVIVSAGGMAWLSSRLASARWGMWNAGVVLAWLGSGATNADTLQLVGESSVIWLILVESVLAAGLGILILMLVARGNSTVRVMPKGGNTSMAEVLPALIGCAGAVGAVVWIVAQDSLPGQALWATATGSLAGALVGRVIWMRVEAFWLVLGSLLPGVLGIAVRIVMGSDGLVEAALSGGLWPVMIPTPVQWLSGALLGVPLGMTWGASLISSHITVDSSTTQVPQSLSEA